MLRTPSRPYLNEAQSAGGDGFDIVSFFMVWVVIGVFAIWAYSARAMLYRVGHFVAPGMVPSWDTVLEVKRAKQIIAGEIPIPTITPTLQMVGQPGMLGQIVQAEGQQVTATNIPIVIEVATATPLPTSTPDPNMPTAMPAPTYTPLAGVELQDWTLPGLTSASKYCLDCQQYQVQVRITHYWPLDGDMNCYDYNDQTGWCDSALFSGLRWENFINLAAACPKDWPIGSWVEIPGIGAYNCLDRGTMVCFEGVCEVDILSPDLGPYDGYVFDANVYITWR